MLKKWTMPVEDYNKEKLQIEFEKLIAAISAHFVSLPTQDIDEGVNLALQEIGQFTQADRCCVFMMSDAEQTIDNTHEWLAPGVSSQKEKGQRISLKDFPWVLHKIYRHEVINIPNVSQLPAEAQTEQQVLQRRQTVSILGVPMIFGETPVGFLALESVTTPEYWTEEIVPLLKIAGTLFVSAFERNKAEQALRASEDRFRQVITSISDHIYFWKVTESGEHVNLYLSPNVEELTGYPYSRFAEDWAFWNRQVIHPDDQPAAARQAAKLAHGQVSEMEYRLVLANGEIIWVRDSGRAEQVGGDILVYGVVSDITERKKAEEALAAERALLAQRVDARTAELSLANAELARAARLKDEFLAAMSHELRTPLNAVLGMSEALQEEVYGSLNDNQLTALARIEESGRHLLSLINDILDLSRIEAGKLELQITKVDIYAVCQSSLHFVDKAARDKQIKVSFELEENVSLYADERRLKQILINLLSNAVKFTPEGGKIGLNVRKDAEHQAVSFSVWDAGIGIAEENIDHLFQPFIQLDSRLSRHYEGTGLGLTLVYRMVEMHQGSVSVTSTLGEGSQFTILLPQHSDVGQPQLEKVDTDETAELIAVGEPSALILLAEDNEANITTFSNYLQAKGYGLVVARDGAEALERVKEYQPDLVLMDIQMPMMDGLAAIRHLRASSKFSDLPIVALTALAMPGDRERCLAAGANEYISKPISLKRLVGVIQSLLNNS